MDRYDNNNKRKKGNFYDDSYDFYDDSDYVSDAIHKNHSRSQNTKNVYSSNERKNNINQSELSKRIQQRNKKSRRKQTRKKIISVVAVIGIVALIIMSGVIAGMYFAVKTEIKDMNYANLSNDNVSKIVYVDYDGEEVIIDDLSTSNTSTWVKPDEISDYLKKATVAIEDERFYKHNGIDIKRTTGATIKFFLSKLGIGDASYGGSTITQQTIKNITKETERTSSRKIKEILRAIAIEQELSKEDILTLYMNVVYYANGCTGVESAANLYFNKTSAELSLAEAATIAGITQSPSYYDPKANPENAVTKRNIVLDKMLELEMISENEHNEAVNSKLVLSNKPSKATEISSFFCEQVVKDVVQDLIKKTNCSEDIAYQQIYNGGYTIYSTYDPDVQEAIDRVYTNTSNFPNSGVQSAIIIMDPYTGEIKGMSGGIGTKKENLSLNRATSDPRQPGSAIKPLSAYGPAIDLGKINAGTVLKDEKLTIGSDDWEPRNAYSGFKGNMLPREAIGRSSNVTAVKVVDEIGINQSYKYLEEKFGLTTLTDEDKNYSSLSLGGLTHGVTVEQMAAAYCVFPNRGKYIEPHTYTKVVDAKGNDYLVKESSAKQALSPASAYIMSDMLTAPVTESYGTATSADLGDMPVYGKTGTTDDNIDKWFVGFTPHYVGAVWYGYDDRREMSVSGNPAVTVWTKIMSDIHDDLEEEALTRPSNVEKVSICTVSGKLARSSCNSEYAYFVKGKEPTKYCSSHSGKDKDKSKSTPKPSETADPKESEKPDSEAEATASPAPNSTSSKTEAPSDNTDKNTQESGNSSTQNNNSGNSETENSSPPAVETPTPPKQNSKNE